MTQVRKRPPATPKQAAACCGPLDNRLDPALFKALSDPTRVSLVACIAKCGRGCSVGEVAECCSVDFSVVSRHLALLARSGVLEPTRSGRTVLYRVRYADLCRALRSLADALEACCPADGAGCKAGCCPQHPLKGVRR
jgi:ArsR family transcriptional regulator